MAVGVVIAQDAGFDFTGGGDGGRGNLKVGCIRFGIEFEFHAASSRRIGRRVAWSWSPSAATMRSTSANSG